MTKLNFPDLFSNRLHLGALDGRAISRLHAYSCNPKFFEFLEFPPHTEMDQSRQYFDKLCDRSNNRTGHYWLINLREENLVIGTFGVIDIDLRKMSTEIGYGLDPDYWGNGYFNEALELVTRYLLEKKGFHRIFAKTFSDNRQSINALEKQGFMKEGRMKDFYRAEIGGQYHDAEILALIADNPK